MIPDIGGIARYGAVLSAAVMVEQDQPIFPLSREKALCGEASAK